MMFGKEQRKYNIYVEEYNVKNMQVNIERGNCVIKTK